VVAVHADVSAADRAGLCLDGLDELPRHVS
jgi:hypothetical protein